MSESFRNLEKENKVLAIRAFPYKNVEDLKATLCSRTRTEDRESTRKKKSSDGRRVLSEKPLPCYKTLLRRISCIT